MRGHRPPGHFACNVCTRIYAATWKGLLRRHYRDGSVCPGSGAVVIPDFTLSDASSPVPDGVSPTPARDPESGSGAVDEMDPSPPGSERGGQLQQGTTGRHTN